MNPVVALDIADKKSMIIVMKSENEVFRKPFEFKHNLIDMDNVYSIIKEVEKITNLKCEMVMEATSIYHEICDTYYTKKGINTLVVNPLMTRLNSNNIRKTKTDKRDCENLAKAYYKGDYIVSSKKEGIYLEMKNLSRQYVSLEKNMVRYKNRFKQLVTVIFPEYLNLFTNKTVYEKKNMLLLKQYSHPNIVLKTSVKEITEYMFKLSGRKSMYLFNEPAIKLKDYASICYYAYDEASYQIQNLREMIDLILDLEDKMDTLRKEIIKLGNQTPYLKILDSIPGITAITAAFIIAELGDINRFNNRNELIAYCGLDSSIKQSGKYHVKGSISKRGNKRVRKILYTVIGGMKMCKPLHINNPIWDFYIKKQQIEGKHKYTSTIAACVKLLRIAFALCKSNTLFKYN